MDINPMSLFFASLMRVPTHGFNVRKLACVIGLLFIAQGLFAQLVNEGIFYVAPSSTVYVPGALQNEGLIMNEGELRVDGDWLNEARYQGTGVIHLSGSDNRVVRHNGDQVNRVLLNATARVELQGRLVIGESMTFNEGIWFNSPRDTLLLQPEAIFEGGNDRSYITGPVHRTGVGYAYFPIGAGNIFAPLVLENVIGASPAYRVEAIPDLPSQTYLAKIRDLYRDVYWEVDVYRSDYQRSAVTVSIPANNYNEDLLGIVYGESLDATDWEFQESSTRISDGRWQITTENSLGPGYYFVAERAIALSDQKAFYFPNSLSPNAPIDENRRLKVFGSLDPESFQLVIFDRSGHVLYQTNDLAAMQENGWGGTSNNGQELLAGSYPYYLKVRETSGRLIEKQGLISIVK